MHINLWDYYIQDAARITDNALKNIRSLADWEREKKVLYRQYLVSMGLDPLPQRCALQLRVTGEIKKRGFCLKKMAYQILPDCWASATLYLPDPLPSPKLPAVLIACGHAAIGTLGYARFAQMWARHGFASMVFDTIEQNDNPGEHRGLHSATRPDWISMGYTAAGGELWNSIRALDVLCAQPEVDAARIGVTGASGGGAHSFFLAVADERISALGSCCGVTLPKHTLDRQHLLTHCDCMYYHNVFRRDMSEFGALIAPRPALFCYGSKDYLFSRSEYTALVKNMQKIYALYGRKANCKLFVYDGPHGYPPQSAAVVSKWFDRHLAGAKYPPTALGGNELSEKEISVFHGVTPQPNRLAMLPELMRPQGAVALPQNPAQWRQIRQKARTLLVADVFRFLRRNQAVRFERLGDWLKGAATYRKYRAQIADNELWIETYVPPRASNYLCVGIAAPDELARPMLLRLCDHASGHALAVIVPRFGGFNYCNVQADNLLRAGCLTGMPPFHLMLQDIFWGINSLRRFAECKGKKLILYGKGSAGIGALYYSILNDDVSGVVLDSVPASHREDAFVLGILPVMDIRHAMGLIAPRKIGLVGSKPSLWASRLYERLGCAGNIVTDISLRGVISKMI